MAWLSSTAWATSDTPVLATVLNNIGLDLRTWGGNVDAGGNQLTNCGGITASSATVTSAAADTALKIVTTATGGHDYRWLSSGTGSGLGSAAIGALSLYDSTAGGVRLMIKANGVVNLGVAPTYASNAAAISGGLVAGDLFADSSGFVRRVF